MNFRESVEQSIDNLAKRKLRSLLTMLGIVFGVGAVISMLAIGAGAEEQAMQAIRQMGLRTVQIEGKEYEPEDLRRVREKSLGLSRRDLQALIDLAPNVARATGRKVVRSYQVFSDYSKVESRVVALGAPWFSMKHLAFLEGSAFDGEDEASYEQVCVLGAAAKRRLFGYEAAVGNPVKINNVWFTVVGVIADQTVSGDEFEGVQLQNTNNEIYIPLSTALKKIEFKPLESELDGIVLEVSNEGETRATALVASKLIAQLHGSESDYSLIVPEQLFEQSRRTQRIFTIVMGCIAGISLLVGGIGIMNIMLANVLERTREIGVRRAIGARRADIRLQFLIEAVTISTLGGVLGVVTGFAIARLVVYLAGWSTIITTASVLLAFGFSTAVGVAFGAYPAVQASRLSPIEALRYE